MISREEYLERDALGAAELVREGEVTPTDLLEAALRQLDHVNPVLNAVVHRAEDEARATATGPIPDGPFRGVPFLLKDLLSRAAGLPHTSGSQLMADFVPDRDSEVVRRCRDAGLVIAGKTSTPELGLTPFTEPELFGPCRNPWDPSRTPGGSSGGSAAAVAGGVVPMAGGGDGGGSIRIPASCCGLFGLKPTRGRVPTGPFHGQLWRGAGTEHVLTRSVRDSAAALDVLSGPDPGAPYVAPPPDRPFLQEMGPDPGGLRIAFSPRPLLGTRLHRDCGAALLDAARLLEDLGHRMEEAAPEVDREAFAEAFVTMICGEVRADIRDAERVMGRSARSGDLEPETRALALLGEEIPADRFATALRTLERTARSVAPFFQDYDLLLTPTLAEPPPLVGALQPSPTERLLLEVLGRLGAGGLLRRMGTLETLAHRIFEFIPFPPLFNVTGQPAASLPLHWNDEGLPVGVHLAGRFGDEATLFRLAAQLEEARPWFHRLPEWIRSPEGDP